MRIIKTILFSCLILAVSSAHAEVIFEDDFNSFSDWTIDQPIAGSSSCSTEPCSIGEWSIYRNQGCLCSSGVTNRPGNNNVYINQYAGYPDETNASYGGSGKSWTHWLEACQAYPTFDDSDMLFAKRLVPEYSDLYVRFYIRFKTNFEFHPDTTALKLWHMWHYKDGDTIWDFHHINVNTPIAAGGINGYGTSVYIYMDGVCNNNLTCHPDIIFPIFNTTTAYQAGGIFDGGWHCIEIRVKMNTVIGAADGIIEAWFDGAKKNYLEGYEGDDIEFNDDGSSELWLWNSVSIGGNNTSFLADGDPCSSDMANCEQWYAIDDVVISTTYVGAEYQIGEQGSCRSDPSASGSVFCNPAASGSVTIGE